MRSAGRGVFGSVVARIVVKYEGWCITYSLTQCSVEVKLFGTDHILNDLWTTGKGKYIPTQNYLHCFYDNDNVYNKIINYYNS